MNLLDGGRIGRTLKGFENSIINVLGGSISWGFIANDSSQVSVSGGLINLGLSAHDNSQVNVSGGVIRNLLNAYGNSQISVSGGLFNEKMYLSHDAVVTIDGSDFAVNGTDVGYIELTSILGDSYRYEPYRRLTGTLLNGNPLNNVFQIGNRAKIVLIPEPATLLLLCLGGMTLLRRKRGYGA